MLNLFKPSDLPVVVDDHSHLHKTPTGWVRCFHNCKSCLTDVSFWLGVTLSFPLEHLIWEKIPPFNLIARYFGLF